MDTVQGRPEREQFPRFPETLGPNGPWRGDCFHLNKAGATAFADGVFRQVQRLLPPPPRITAVTPAKPRAADVNQQFLVKGNDFRCPNSNEPNECLSVHVVVDGTVMTTLHAPGQIFDVAEDGKSFTLLATFASPGVYEIAVMNPTGDQSKVFPITVRPAVGTNLRPTALFENERCVRDSCEPRHTDRDRGSGDQRGCCDVRRQVDGP